MGVFLVVVVVVVVIVVVIVVVVVVVVFAVVAIFLVDLSRFPGAAPVWLPPSLSLIPPPFSLFCALSRLPLSPASLHSASRVGAPMWVLAGCLIGCLVLEVVDCCCRMSERI